MKNRERQQLDRNSLRESTQVFDWKVLKICFKKFLENPM